MRPKGVAEAQKLERFFTKLIWDNEDHQRTNVRRQVHAMRNDWLESRKVLQRALLEPDNTFDSDAKANSQQFMKSGVQLMHILRLKTDDYKIRFCRPGNKFDATWMETLYEDGSADQPGPTEPRKLIMCLFPALLQHMAHDATMVFVKDKRFILPDDEYSSLEYTVVAKASVMLE